jgi:hypothetical protein
MLLILLQESVVTILGSIYHDRNYARFFVLETIARVPYFGGLSPFCMLACNGLKAPTEFQC